MTHVRMHVHQHTFRHHHHHAIVTDIPTSCEITMANQSVWKLERGRCRLLQSNIYRLLLFSTMGIRINHYGSEITSGSCWLPTTPLNDTDDDDDDDDVDGPQ